MLEGLLSVSLLGLWKAQDFVRSQYYQTFLDSVFCYASMSMKVLHESLNTPAT